MSDVNDFDDEEREEQSVDDDEAKAAQKGAVDDNNGVSDAEIAEAETLTVTAKQHAREQLEDELARFLAQGGQITQIAPDENLRD